MKQPAWLEGLLRILVLFAVVGSTAVQADRSSGSERDGGQERYDRGGQFEQQPVVSYDGVNDSLSVSADSVPIKLVLGRIAALSGIEVLFDDKADGPLTIDIESESLEPALKRMLRGSNYMMRYNRNEQQELLLVGVMVLPEGEYDSSRAKRILGLGNEAAHRRKVELSAEQSQALDLATERWHARLTELPDEMREELEAMTERRLRKEAEYLQKKKERRVKRQQKREEQERRDQAMFDKAMSGYTPEERAAFEARRNEAAESMKSSILESLNK